MADPRDDEGLPPAGADDIEDDLMGEEGRADPDEEEGEDLLGDNWLDDYREANPEEDQYDPDLIDDEGEHEQLTVEQRLAAEEAMRARDDREGRVRRRGEEPPVGTPAFRATLRRRNIERSPEDSVLAPSDMGDLSTQPVRKRLRSEMELSPGESEGSVDLSEDEVPESSYDLTNERAFKELLEEDDEQKARLEKKIKTCFQQFLRKFTLPNATEPKYPDLMRKMAEEHQSHLDVSFQHLQDWSAPLSLWISDHPLQVLPLLNQELLNEVASKFRTYAAIKDAGEDELRVAIHSFPVKEPIRDLCTRHLDKLVSVTGVATKRSGVFNQVRLLMLRCAKCNYPKGPFLVSEDRDFKAGSCLECQSSGPYRVDRKATIYRNYQKITLQEAPGSVQPGKMPRSKEVILTGDQVDTVRPGDELTLTGVYKCLSDPATNARMCFPVFKTEIEAIHCHRKGDLKMVQINEDQQKQIWDLARRPDIKDLFIASMAPSIYGMTHVKTAIALSIMGGEAKIAAGKHRIRGDINTLIVGDPGMAKSQFLKYIEQTFPRAVYTSGKGASAVGLTAAVMRDENGDWCLQGGAMVLADDGMCLIDEFDKMNDQDRTSIHEAMEQQTISISKAGIVATLQARCAVVAVANPTEGRYDPQRTFSQNVNLSDPILSRFDMLCVLRDESDPVQDELLAEHVICSHMRSHPEANAEERQIQPRLQQQASAIQPIDQDLLQKYIVYARTRVHPKLRDIDNEKLANFYKDLRAEAFRSGGAPMTARHMDSLMRITEAFARMELRDYVTEKDVDNAMSVMLESFIQSQKHQVAEELRKKFRRYISQATPMADQFMNMFEKLFKEKVRSMQLRQGAGAEPVEQSTVGVPMEDVLRQIEAQELDLEQANIFMRTERFSKTFRLEGENLMRN